MQGGETVDSACTFGELLLEEANGRNSVCKNDALSHECRGDDIRRRNLGFNFSIKRGDAMRGGHFF